MTSNLINTVYPFIHCAHWMRSELFRVHDVFPITRGQDRSLKHRHTCPAGKNGRPSVMERCAGHSNHEKVPVPVPTPRPVLASTRGQGALLRPPRERPGPSTLRSSPHWSTALRHATAAIEEGHFGKGQLFREHVHTPPLELQASVLLMHLPDLETCRWLWRRHRLKGSYSSSGGVNSRGREMSSESASFQWKAPALEGKIEGALILGWERTLASAIGES